jgi:hypothetical protein
MLKPERLGILSGSCISVRVFRKLFVCKLTILFITMNQDTPEFVGYFPITVGIIPIPLPELFEPNHVIVETL